MRPMRRDLRPRAVALTVGAVVILGWLAGMAPGGARLQAMRAAPSIPEQPTSRKQQIDRWFNEAVRMIESGRQDAAVEALRRLIELAPHMPEARVNMRFALFDLARYREARASFMSAIDLRAQQANAYYGLAIASERLDDRPAAIGAMRTFLHSAVPDERHRARAAATLQVWEAQRRALASREQPPAPELPTAAPAGTVGAPYTGIRGPES